MKFFAEQIITFLQPLTVALANPGIKNRLLYRIGVFADSDSRLTEALAAVAALADECRTLASQSEASFEGVKALLDVSRKAFVALSNLVDDGEIVSGGSSLGVDLSELLIGIWLVHQHPIARNVAIILGLLQPAWEQAPSPPSGKGGVLVRDSFRIDRLRLDRLIGLIRDPVAALKAEYLNPLATDADADALADRLFPRLETLLAGFGVVARYGVGPGDPERLGPWATPMARVFAIYTGGGDAGGVFLSIAAASQGDLGLVVSPFGALNFADQAGPWSWTTEATAGVDIVAWGRRGVTLLAGQNVTQVTARATATLTAPDTGPAKVFGALDGTRLEVGGVELIADTKLSATTMSLALSADVSKSTLVISGGDSDGFIASILPAEGLRADFDLGIGWSSDRGLTLRGAVGLQATFPVGFSIGGLTLTTINTALIARDGRIDAALTASLTASIGPATASVEGIGLATGLTFPDKGGNLGAADLTLGLKGPTGVGIAIDTQGVLTGGGFLRADPATGGYGGVVQLSLHEKITLTGFGLIATRMPDGSRGFSLLVFITADGFQPVPLGFGFMLRGIGGMLGVNRTFDLEVLRSGLKSDSLAQLLFPRDPVGNAPALLQALAATFPIRKGSYLIGLLAQITWGTPTLVQLDLALILELGARTRLLVLGRVSALLPTRDNDLIRLNLDTVGVLDFDAGSFEADAALVDSRIAHRFPITGSAALRARWGGSPNFILAVGGVNPRFAPPAGFPQLERVAIALCAGENPRLICDSYFAITSNTVQFGAHVSLYAKAFGFSVTGDMGFDALVTLSPPHFIIDFHAAVQLKRGSHNLFKITLDGTLEGPLPLRLNARATFDILFMSYSVRFDFTLADGPAGQAAPSVRLEDEVRKALADPASWSTRTTSGPGHGVVLRALPAGAPLILDPLGQLIVQQQVAPLNTVRPVNTYGGVSVAGPQHFKLTAAFDGQACKPLQAAFAPARYHSMADDAKLVAPSFQDMDAGVVLGDDLASFDGDTLVPGSLSFDQHIFNPLDVPPAPPAPAYEMPLEALQLQRPTGAAGRAPARNVGRGRFRNPAAGPGVKLNTPEWRVVQAFGAPHAQGIPGTPVTPGDVSWTEGQAIVDRMNDSWVLVPAYELVA